MPVHTHHQAAMPVTYGWYLLGVATALGRDLDALRTAAAGLDACPLGAGAVAGTDLPIDPARTARLLGFAGPAAHALDAVASRDVPLRVLGAAAGLAVTLSRLAADLQLWSTAEFGFVHFPDRLVGGSSAMPQKRNAFLLEHVRAKPAQALGAWAAAASAMAATPFTNSIEVGTEAVASVWTGLAAAEQAVLLAQVLVAGARTATGPQRTLTLSRYAILVEAAIRPTIRAQLLATGAQVNNWAMTWLRVAGSTDPERDGPIIMNHYTGVVLHDLAIPDPAFDPTDQITALVTTVIRPRSVEVPS
jgi:argininosuccinate lyase